ncbi:endospore germination permease [Paenibacillus chondroitinus]|uniref:Endospore germination permease n=1 Tax=Paenibacillus chondroitinus TaxID=59842 RepID=A0ABU6DFH6_9BACL|nr:MULTISPECIES: endospore germination permease [Paenibacillus]MCY9659153.1 spore germination protein [Paenibacillus anseongense]MEB4796512.1 endospore germination permease [Paenibacillus chondroitinus]
MQTTEKITANQLGILLFSYIASTIILTIPGLMAMFAKQDAWISVIPSTTTGLLSIWVMIKLANRYPGLTIIAYSQKILGKWLGTCLGLYYIYFWLMSISIMTIQHTFFIKTLLLPRSPSIIGSLTLLILCGLAVYMGIEVIGRCSEFLTPLKLVFLIPLLILTIGAADHNHLKPILADGFLPVLQGAILPAGAFMNQLFILGWLLPYLNQPQKARKTSLYALLFIFIFIFVVVFSSILVLGSLTGQLNYAYLSVIQYIGIEGSFERLEAIAVMVWVIGSFVKVSVSLFILCLSISQVFGIRNYRDLVAPITMLSLIGSVWIFRNGAELQNYLTFIYPSGGFVTQSLIPLLLLLIDTIKRKVVASPH